MMSSGNIKSVVFLLRISPIFTIQDRGKSLIGNSLLKIEQEIKSPSIPGVYLCTKITTWKRTNNGDSIQTWQNVQFYTPTGKPNKTTGISYKNETNSAWR